MARFFNSSVRRVRFGVLRLADASRIRIQSEQKAANGEESHDEDEDADRRADDP